MKLNRDNLRKLILEEYKKVSELKEFSSSKPGQKFASEGKKIWFLSTVESARNNIMDYN